MEATSIDATALGLAIVSLIGTALSLWFGYRQQMARLLLDTELVTLKARVKEAEDEQASTKKELQTTQADLVATKEELAVTKNELAITKKELVDKDAKMGSLESRVRDLERHNGTLELERNAKASQISELLGENAELKAQLDALKRPNSTRSQGKRREL